MAASILVVGAGMAGLSAARTLRAAGLRVSVLDKGRAVGGRMATRRIGPATFDHGAQHVSVRTPAFAEVMASLVDAGTARVWLHTQSVTQPERGIEPRYAGVGGMRRISEALAAGLDVTTAVTVDRLDVGSNQVTAVANGTPVATADAVILTPPLPQAMALLAASGLPQPDDLMAVGYDATLAVMATLDAPAGLDDGHSAVSGGAVAWIADNQHKGASEVPAVTIHSTPEFAAAHLDDDPDEWVAALLTAARPHHRGEIVHAAGHRWRYAQPRNTFEFGAVALDAAPRVILAGEAFSGARVEGAFTSGVAAAQLVHVLLG